MVSQEQQVDAIKYIADTFDGYKSLMQDRMDAYLDIYKEYTTFTIPKKNNWDTTFKVNKMHEVVNKTLPRIMSKNPKRLVSSKPDMITTELDKIESKEEKIRKIEELDLQSKIVQSYLTLVFEKYNQTEPARLRAKNMLIYWSAFAKIDFAYEIARSTTESVDEESEYNESGEEVGKRKVKNKKIEEKVFGEYPTIDPVSWADIYYDPRYKMFRQMPWFIEFKKWVRIGQLEHNKEEYINLDKLRDIVSIPTTLDSRLYKEQIYTISWMQLPEAKTWVNKNSLELKIYYWRYDLDWEEKLYKITTVDDILVICMKEITQIPFVQIRCFEDTETNFWRWLCEPIMGLQQELNFKKNSASVYVNNALNRSWIYSPNSGINPKDLVSKPNGIIPTSKSIDEVQKNLFELPLRTLTPDFFNEQNDFERQIQAMTFTVDTSNPRTQNSLTNTATWARIKFFESNTVIDEIRKHFEDGLTTLWYKLLEATFENMEDNIIIKEESTWKTREVNKELIKDAIMKYEIKIETGSSVLDNPEDRRDDAIAKFNMAVQAIGAWVPVDMTEAFKNVLEQFEVKDVNRFIKDPKLEQMMGMWGWMWQPWMQWWGMLQPPQQQPSTAEWIVWAVAQGDLTTAS